MSEKVFIEMGGEPGTDHIHAPTYTAKVIRFSDREVIKYFPSGSKDAAVGDARSYITKHGYEEVPPPGS